MTVHTPIQADFRYDHADRRETGLTLSLSVFADRGHLRDAIREDALAVGLNIREAASLVVLREGAARPLGDVVIVDCPELDAATMAALVRLAFARGAAVSVPSMRLTVSPKSTASWAEALY